MGVSVPNGREGGGNGQRHLNLANLSRRVCQSVSQRRRFRSLSYLSFFVEGEKKVFFSILKVGFLNINRGHNLANICTTGGKKERKKVFSLPITSANLSSWVMKKKVCMPNEPISDSKNILKTIKNGIEIFF